VKVPTCPAEKNLMEVNGLRLFRTASGPAPPLRRAYLTGTLLFILLTLAVVNGSSWWFFRSMRTQLEDELGARLLAVATLTAGALDGEGFAEALEENPAESLYLLEAESLLSRFSRAAADASAPPAGEGALDAGRGVTNITLLALDGRVLADAQGRLPVGIQSPLLDLDRGASTAARVGIPGTTDLYEESGFFYKTAYAGVTDSRGRVCALVAVEASADFFQTLAVARYRLWTALAVSGIAIVALGALFLWLQRAMSRVEETVRRTETLTTMGQMVASLAHEIRNPLGIIGGAAERIKEKYGGDRDEIFDYIRDEVGRLNGVLTAYLDFARSPGEGRESVDIAQAADRALVLLESELAKRGIVVERDFGGGEPFEVRADPARLQQVFLNLFLNARDAMPGGGRLTVGARRAHKGVEVFVRDSGEGVAPEALRRIFEPFYSGKEKGSGLGLAIVEKIVREHGGRIRAESRPGRGTAFRIELPV
jgi:signal transduction histidine kinase